MTDASALKRLATADHAMISDCMSRIGISGWMDGLHVVNAPKVSVAGAARTILFGPKRGEGSFNKTMYAIIEMLKPGEILVLAAGGTAENLLGDNVVAYAQHHKVGAFVADSMVRDVENLTRMALPVFSRGITARVPAALEPVAMDVPVVCAGAQVRPGDVLVGGIDGILVLPPSRVNDILFELEDVEEIEAEMQRVIAGGGPASAIEPLLKRKKNPRPKKAA